MPALELTVRRSRCGGLLCGLGSLLVMGACLQLLADGQHWVALVGLPLALACLWRLGRQPWAGWVLCRRQGDWLWRAPNGQEHRLQAPPQAVCLPCLVHLRWRVDGRRRGAALCLFRDSAGESELRQLRRLLLAGPGD